MLKSHDLQLLEYFESFTGEVNAGKSLEAFGRQWFVMMIDSVTKEDRLTFTVVLSELVPVG